MKRSDRSEFHIAGAYLLRYAGRRSPARGNAGTAPEAKAK